MIQQVTTVLLELVFILFLLLSTVFISTYGFSLMVSLPFLFITSVMLVVLYRGNENGFPKVEGKHLRYIFYLFGALAAIYYFAGIRVGFVIDVLFPAAFFPFCATILMITKYFQLIKHLILSS